ncbi:MULTISPECIES: hypothetical protein [Pseudomonas]|uniref:hypothetical protein n=1 Tax=Pseudomonas nitroreducens TaxID=46680 RepID=UPI001E48F495|nr:MULTISPECIES: hypothetical protein [Pseudomonas]MCE4073520.1 hypothetical protein [Pseudomonas nitritireducens]MCE4079759.1 hypothetical protein [Pseudomonas nitroreducens]
MTQEKGWPDPLAGVLNPIDDPYAAAQQMAVAMVRSGFVQGTIDPEQAAERVVALQRRLTEQYLKLRDHYDCSGH